MSEHQRRALVRELRNEVARCADREQLLVRARQWLYEHRLLVVHDRAIRALIAAAPAQLEAETGAMNRSVVEPGTRDRWRRAIAEPRADGQTQQGWLWATPARRSTRQITEVLERIELLYGLEVHKHLGDLPDLILRRYARRLASRPPSAGARIKAGILAHGTRLTAVECGRMIPQLSAASIRQAMRWAGDERRLAQACQAVLEFMQRHPIHGADAGAPGAERRCFEKAMARNGEPETVTIDKSGSNLAALQALNAERETPIKIRQNKYLNNVVEQDHRAIKRRTRPMPGFGDTGPWNASKSRSAQRQNAHSSALPRPASRAAPSPAVLPPPHRRSCRARTSR